MTEIELIRKVVSGDADAFGPLVQRYQHAVYGVAFSIVRDLSAAEDVAQEAFIRAYTRLPELRDPAKFPPWLRRITANTARMWCRQRRSQEAPLEADFGATPEPTGLKGEVADALAALPEQKRRVVILCYVNGISRVDAARFLGVPPATLRKRLHDAKRLLQKRIVAAAERSFEQHLLPKDFASRCICGCKRAHQEMKPMATKKNVCRCGCLSPEKKSRVDRRRKKNKGRASRPQDPRSGA